MPHPASRCRISGWRARPIPKRGQARGELAPVPASPSPHRATAAASSHHPPSLTTQQHPRPPHALRLLDVRLADQQAHPSLCSQPRAACARCPGLRRSTPPKQRTPTASGRLALTRPSSGQAPTSCAILQVYPGTTQTTPTKPQDEGEYPMR